MSKSASEHWGPNDPKWIQPYIVPVKLWLNQRPGGLERQIIFYQIVNKTWNDITGYWWDEERLANFHKPFSSVIRAWYIEPSQKFWVQYALKKGIITQD